MSEPYPASRDEVLDECQDLSWVHDVEPCGPGLSISAKTDNRYTRLFTTLLEDYGWYCSEYEPVETGDIIHIMPVPEEVTA